MRVNPVSRAKLRPRCEQRGRSIELKRSSIATAFFATTDPGSSRSDGSSRRLSSKFRLRKLSQAVLMRTGVSLLEERLPASGALIHCHTPFGQGNSAFSACREPTHNDKVALRFLHEGRKNGLTFTSLQWWAASFQRPFTRCR